MMTFSASVGRVTQHLAADHRVHVDVGLVQYSRFSSVGQCKLTAWSTIMSDNTIGTTF
jgi:hypothetical protein